MKKLNKKQASIGIGALTTAILCTVAAFALTPVQLNDNPWEHALLAGEKNGSVSSNNRSFIVNGDIRSYIYAGWSASYRFRRRRI